ncbi:aminotransferase class III-fold pyridoxal phosphate-dependent enzyme [Candidatus Daviesbacteria bacterium]|nr:aminotransferase class III-fold pyridoxal phosphate-dependent enzyme [Candidatus Daviesbacteria bacterium]
MNSYQIAKKLKNRYLPNNIDFSLANRRHSFLSECIIPTDIVALSGKGATLKTNKGELIDFASMTVNCILGQNDPWVNANLIAYLLSGRPSFLTTRVGHDYYYKVADRICKTTKMTNSVINHRQCNGTDVTELAILAAYKHRQNGQHILASFSNSYHGQGLTAYLASGLQRKHLFLVHESPVVFLDEPDHTEDIDTQDLTEHDKNTLEKLYDIRDKVFAVIIEPIQVNNSVNTSSKAFLKRLKYVCESSKIALIFDEIQTGFGWLGKITAAERYGVWPNLMALSKALTAGNGPLSALVSDKIYQDIVEGTGAKTNGADIRSLVAANAVMDRLLGIPEQQIPSDIDEDLYKELRSGLLSQFDQKCHQLLLYLKDLQSLGKGLIGKIKGDGLIRGLEIVNAKGVNDALMAKKLQLQLLESGVLVRQNQHTLIFKPPIVITEKEMAKGFGKIQKIISSNL